MADSQTLLIVGAGRHGRIVAETARLSGAWRVVAFADDNPALVGTTIDGVPVVADGRATESDAVVVAIGDNAARERIFGEVKALGRALGTVVSPRAFVSAGANLGEGTVVLAGAVIQSGASVGANVIVNIGVLIDHDARVRDHANLLPGVILASFATVASRERVAPGTVRTGTPPVT